MSFKTKWNKPSASTEKTHKVTKSDPRYSIFHQDSSVYIFLHKHPVASFFIIFLGCFAITVLLISLIVFIFYLTH